MSNESNYPQMQLGLAVKCLVGSGSMAERLKNAYSIALHKLNRSPAENDFSEELTPQWTAISDRLKNISALTEEEAEKVAEDVLELYETVLTPKVQTA